MSCIFTESAIYRTDTVNLDAVANAATLPSGALAVGVTLSGYNATDILRFTLPSGLTYAAWSPWNNPSPAHFATDGSGSGAVNCFMVMRNGDTGDVTEMGAHVSDHCTVYDGYEAARAAFPDGGLDQITGATNYTFFIQDNPISDNGGGLSIVVDACPCLEIVSAGSDPCANFSGYTDADLSEGEPAVDAVWPVDLQPRNIGIDAMYASLSGGPSLVGPEPAVAGTAGYWRFRFEAIPVNTKSRVLAFREIAAKLDGRAGVCLVPLFDGKRAPQGANVIASGAIAEGATSGAMQFNTGGPPQPGQHFSAGERSYRLTTVGAASSGDTYPVTFWPPVRTLINDGEALDFATPACRMRLATDDAMNLTLQDLQFGSATVTWVEDI